ncbi:MAG TPA: hypothetical protein VHJ58_10100 [Vicinamibacterales bacterium]|nr:hypothetical protein [Vicinamibacterales bacterium]
MNPLTGIRGGKTHLGDRAEQMSSRTSLGAMFTDHAELSALRIAPWRRLTDPLSERRGSRSAAAELSLVGMSGNRLSDQFGGWARLVPATPVDHVNAAGSDVGRVEHLYRGPFVGG